MDQGGLSLCDPERKVLVVFQSSLNTQADSSSSPHPPETRELQVRLAQRFSKPAKVKFWIQQRGTERSLKKEVLRAQEHCITQRGAAKEGILLALAVEPPARESKWPCSLSWPRFRSGMGLVTVRVWHSFVTSTLTDLGKQHPVLEFYTGSYSRGQGADRF